MCTRPIRLLQHKEVGRTVPCGICIECRSRYARMWAIRCVHEASLHDENCFGTLTYDDGHMPERGSLKKRDFQLFMKRLRKSLGKKKVRFYHAGEYGDQNRRPHYHFLLFGHTFPAVQGGLGLDTPVSKSSAHPTWRSPELEALWPLGFSSLGDVTFESAQYIARYVMKKVDKIGVKKQFYVDDDTGEMHEIEPEYSTMSRRPGIGRGWYEKFQEEVTRLETVRINGVDMQPPRYYDDLLKQRDAAAHELLKLRRIRKSRGERMTGERLAREAIAKRRLFLYSQQTRLL